MDDETRKKATAFLNRTSSGLKLINKKPYVKKTNIFELAKVSGLLESETRAIETNGSASSIKVEFLAAKIPFFGLGYEGQRAEKQKVEDVIFRSIKSDNMFFDDPEIKCGVRGMAKKVDFNPSKDKGVGRKKCWETIIEDLTQLDYYIICDICNAEERKFFVLDTTEIVKAMVENKIPFSGFSRNSFYKFIQNKLNYEINVD